MKRSSKEALPSNPEWDCILLAAQKNRAEDIIRLVESGVSPNHTNSVGQSALHVAVLWGHVQATLALLQSSVHVNAVNQINGSTPLHLAVQSTKEPKLNRVECARLLIELGGADVSAEDWYEMTPLDHLNVMEKDDVGFDHETNEPFYIAMRNLLTPPEKGDEPFSAIFLAISSLDIEKLKNILSHGTTNQDQSNLLEQIQVQSGLNPLWFAIDKLVRIIEYEDCNDDINTLLDIINLLLQSGSNPNPIRKDRLALMDKKICSPNLSEAPLHFICQKLQKLHSNTDAAISSRKFILEKCAVSLKKYGAIIGQDTVFLMHDAVRRNNIVLLSFLIEKLGLDPNSRGRQGMTALHFASRSGHKSIVQFLLETNVDTTLMDDLGLTALDAARINEKDEVVQILLENVRKVLKT